MTTDLKNEASHVPVARARWWGLPIAASLAVLPMPGSAEGFRDLYGGYTLSHEAHVDHRFNGDTGQQPSSTTSHLSFPSSGEFGIRRGSWFEWAPALGLAGDLSYFSRESAGSDFNLVAASVLVMLRAGAPRRLQLYGGAGPSLVISDASLDFGASGRVSEWSLSPGNLDARLGVTWCAGKSSTLFVEYRFTRVDLEYEEEECLALFCFGDDAPTRTVSTTQARIDSSHVSLGLRF